ncbi:MAG: DUF4185 domain-containing protein [Kiritimatiellales bacterium]|nr:DUF4185 domain-containing protein [Kiritimatiellales bacterium]
MNGLALNSVVVLVVLTCVGCSSEPAWRKSGIPSEVRIEVARDLGPMKFIEAIRGRDGGYSAEFQGQSVWVFGDSIMQKKGVDGSQWRTSTWCQTGDRDARDNLQDLAEPVDTNGVPYEFLPFTETEARYNGEHFTTEVPEGSRSRWGLWPGPVVVSPDGEKAYVFYNKIFGGPNGQWDFHSVGRSIAVWNRLDEHPVRPVIHPGAEHPTMLFPAGDSPWGDCAIVEDGMLYVFGCESKWLAWPMTLARAPFDQALDRSAWRFYSGKGKWSADWRQAVPVFEGAPMMSVSWNRWLGRYLAVYSAPLENRIVVRTAKHLEGPWSDPLNAVDCIPPTNTNQWCYSGLSHDEFSRSDGRVMYFSYYRETGFLQGEVRLVEVSFGRGPENEPR